MEDPPEEALSAYVGQVRELRGRLRRILTALALAEEHLAHTLAGVVSADRPNAVQRLHEAERAHARVDEYRAWLHRLASEGDLVE